MIPTGGADTTATRPALRHNRDFNLLWTSQTLSDLGAHTTVLAVPLLVLAVTGSPARAGVVGTIAAVVQAFFRLPAGALADRWNRRTVMLTCDGARICLFAVLATMVWLGQASFAVILIVTGLAVIFDVSFSPAETAAISKLVPADQLSDAFARNEARAYGTSLAGPPLGGFLYGLAPVVPFVFDVATYLVSFLSVTRIRQPMQGERKGPRRSVAADIADGVRHVLSEQFLRSLLLIAAPLNFAVTGSLFTITLTLRQSGHPASVVGVTQGIVGVGGFLGALAASWLQRRFSLRTLVTIVAWALAACILSAAAVTTHIAVAAPLAAGLFLAPAANAALFGRMAATTPNELQARVTSVVMLGATSAAALAPLAAGLIIQHLGGAAAMLLFAVSVGLSALTATLNPGMHSETAPAASRRPSD